MGPPVITGWRAPSSMCRRDQQHPSAVLGGSAGRAEPPGTQSRELQGCGLSGAGRQQSPCHKCMRKEGCPGRLQRYVRSILY